MIIILMTRIYYFGACSAVAVPVLFSLLSSPGFGIGKFLFIFIMKLSITAIKEPQFITLKTKQK